MPGEKQNKTEKPTGWRLQEAKKKGNVPRSRELVTSFSLLMTVILLTLLLPYMGGAIIDNMHQYLGRAGQETLTPSVVTAIFGDSFWLYVRLLFPIFAVIIAVVFLLTVVQGGYHWTSENLRFRLSKFHLLNGLKRIFMSLESFFELSKSLLKVVAIGAIAYFTLKRKIPELLALPYLPLPEILRQMGRLFLQLSLYIIVFMLVLSIGDYLWQRWRYMTNLKMSKQEIRDEFKMKEGDPQIKSRQRSIQFQKAIQRMMAAVPKADVVITNPSHYAVALQYEFKKMPAPRLVAKGKDLIAERIKEVARENRVPLVENPPLAQALFGGVEIGELIPAEFFKPVAEVLAYVYKLKGRKIS
jgi:flagellar biosynthetic protein FlhB